MSNKKTRKFVRNDSNDVFDVMTKMGVEKEKVDKVKKQTAAIESAKKSMLNAKITRKEARDLEYLAPIFEKLKGGPSKREESATQLLKNALKPSPLARRVELELRNNANMEPDERHEVEDLLRDSGLTIDAPKRLEIECNYREVRLKGAMKKKDLQAFLETHPGHHLAIFSVARNRVKYCFFVPDLIKFFLSEMGEEITRAQINAVTWAEWDDLRIRSNEVTFTGREVLSAIELEDAYERLLDLLSETTDVQQLRNLQRLGSSIAPAKKESAWRRVWNKVAREAGRRLEKVWRLIGLKMAADILAGFMCVLALCYGFSAFAPVELTKTWLTAVQTFLVGNVATQVFSAFKSVAWPTGILKSVVDVVASPIRALGIPWLPEIIELVGGVVLGVTANTIALASFAAISAAFFSGVTAGFAAGATGATVAAAIISGPTSLFMANGALISWALVASVTAEVQLRGFGLLVSVLDPHSSGITTLLQVIATGSVCKVFGSIFGLEAGRVCKSLESNALIAWTWYSLWYSIFDLCVFVTKIWYPDKFAEYTTRCESAFTPILTPPTSADTPLTPPKPPHAEQPDFPAGTVQEQVASDLANQWPP